MKKRTAHGGFVISLIVAAILFISPAYAEQNRITTEPGLILGYANFLDESPLHHFVTGGSVRIYLTRRFAIEPELVYMYRSTVDQDWVFVPNLTWDFRDPGKRVVPYVIGGAGILRHRGMTGTGLYSSNSTTVAAGFGAKVLISKRFFVAPEFRMGLEPIFRVTCRVGYSFLKK